MAVKQFIAETETLPDKEAVLASVLGNIVGKIPGHDIWLAGDSTVDAYCLCRTDLDADGSRVYTAYQLWIDKRFRSYTFVRNIIKHLQEYAKKSEYKRMYVVSSRLDKIKAYARGLGNDFKIQSVIFVDDFKENRYAVSNKRKHSEHCKQDSGS